jgi:prefoldin subunit 5
MENENEINDLNEQIENLKEKIKELEEGNNKSEFIDFLNDSYAPYKIGNLEFYAGDILKNIDPIAFNEALNNYNDSEITDLNNQLDDLNEELNDLK